MLLGRLGFAKVVLCIFKPVLLLRYIQILRLKNGLYFIENFCYLISDYLRLLHLFLVHLTFDWIPFKDFKDYLTFSKNKKKKLNKKKRKNERIKERKIKSKSFIRRFALAERYFGSFKCIRLPLIYFGYKF